MAVYIKFERPRDDFDGPEIGPFNFVEMTYGWLRVGPEGVHIGEHAEDDHWYLNYEDAASHGIELPAGFQDVQFSDVTIYSKE